jgi:hypothetical protein
MFLDQNSPLFLATARRPCPPKLYAKEEAYKGEDWGNEGKPLGMRPFVIILGSGKLIISDKYLLIYLFLGGNYEEDVSCTIDGWCGSRFVSAIYSI